MARLQEVSFQTQPLQRFEPFAGAEAVAALREAVRSPERRLRGRVVWNVNSTAVGGGVAEMLRPLLGTARGLGIDARWIVIEGRPDFFRVTKRLHHALHGSAGDGTDLADAERAVYEDVLAGNAEAMCALVSRGDVVVLHDPQTAGLARRLREAGALVIWRCHIGYDGASAEVDRGWAFLRPYLEQVPAYVFSRPSYVPGFCDHGRSAVIPPSIDVFSPKNQELDDDVVHAILVHAGLVAGPAPSGALPSFLRADGSPGRVGLRAEVRRSGSAPSHDTPLVVQVSRWDPLKDMRGVMDGFARMLDRGAPEGVELVLAGPDVRSVSDDPEGTKVYAEVEDAWSALPDAVRRRVHLALLPSDDVDENAALVNALQRHAAVVVQKSVREGFGLTVTEAMWKRRPVVASRVGGIQDQIEHEVSGLLVDDPTDLGSFADLVAGLLLDAGVAQRLGAGARERVRDQFLGLRHLQQYADLIDRLSA